MTSLFRAIFIFSILTSLSQTVFASNQLKVTIEGVENELLLNVKNTLSIMREEKETATKELTITDIKRNYTKADKEIRQALKPYGFYNIELSKTLKEANEHWEAKFFIEKGPRVIIKKFAIEIIGSAKNDETIQQFLDTPPIKPGDPLNHSQYTLFKDKLFNIVFDKGYIDARYTTSQLQVDIDNNHAFIKLILLSGEQFFFGDITVEQDVINKEKIDRLKTLDQKTPFNSRVLLDMQLKLSDTGFFGNMEIDVQREKTINNLIPVVIKTTPSKKLKYSTSFGYGTDTGARLGFSFLNRRVNKKGHRFQTSLQLSEVENSIATQYVVPIGDINNEYFDFFANAKQETLNDVDTTQYKTGLSLNKNFLNGRTRASLTLLQEQFSFDDTDTQTANLLLAGLSFTYKKSDNALFTRKGYSFISSIHGGTESTLSDTSILNTTIKGRYILPISNNSRFLSRLEVGAIYTSEFDELPPSERFFTGGDQSVRGYDFKDIGSRDVLDNNIGGDRLLASSIEIDHLPWGNFGYAVFYDTGDVSLESSLSLKSSAGLGFRYRSAIGMIRVDLAHPFDDPDTDVRLHISIGPDL